MARPERHECDYFPFIAKDGRTLYLLESKYQCKGTGFFTNVMRFLTLETDHHVNISDESDRMYFFTKCHCDEESAMDMLNIMSKTGKIDIDLWKYKIIASQALLDSLADAYRNRKNNIISMEEIKKKWISYDKNDVSYAGNPVSSARSTQRIGKDRIGKDIPDEQKPGGNHYTTKLGDLVESINGNAKQISTLKLKQKINIYQIITGWVNSGKPAGIIDELLKKVLMIKNGTQSTYLEDAKNPYKYLDIAMQTKYQNYNEKRSIEESEQEKNEFLDLVNKLKSFHGGK